MKTISICEKRITWRGYVLAHFEVNGNKYICFIDPDNGNRWTDPIRVDDYRTVTERELQECISSNTYNDIKIGGVYGGQR